MQCSIGPEVQRVAQMQRRIYPLWDQYYYYYYIYIIIIVKAVEVQCNVLDKYNIDSIKSIGQYKQWI